MDRRALLRRSAEVGFLALATSTVVGFKPNPAFANGCQKTEGSACNVIGFGRCSNRNANWCNVGGCNVAGDGYGDGSPCTFYYTDEWSQTACWCTTNACYGCSGGNPYCGHWKCCDCKCGSSNEACSCTIFVYTCPTALAGMQVPMTPSTDLDSITAQLLSGLGATPNSPEFQCC
jgi:hypothetical protein